MDSLATHLEKLTREKQKSVQEVNGAANHSAVICPPSQSSYGAMVCVDQYLVPLAALEEEPTSHLCVDSSSGEQLNCRVYDAKLFQSRTDLYLAGIQGVHPSKEMVMAGERVFVFSEQTYEDLHQYLRDKKKLTEVQAAPLFRQIVELVRDAHSKNIALRDIKLKKFVFEDVGRSRLSLQHLDDAQVMPDSGQLADRHGCPAYVSPEMLQPGSYSGQAADLWSLGVILYTLLVGHYPFFDSSPLNLFSKVRSGYYHVPDHVSELVRSLISSLLAYEPEKRVSAWSVLQHPWFKHTADVNFTAILPVHSSSSYFHYNDQTVPHLK